MSSPIFIDPRFFAIYVSERSNLAKDVHGIINDFKFILNSDPTVNETIILKQLESVFEQLLNYDRIEEMMAAKAQPPVHTGFQPTSFHDDWRKKYEVPSGVPPGPLANLLPLNPLPTTSFGPSTSSNFSFK